MVTIDRMTMTVTVEGSSGSAAFDRLFARAIDAWWREVQVRAAREARTAADRTIASPGRGR